MYLTHKQACDKDLITQLAEQALQTPIKTIQALDGQISYNYEINHNTILKFPSHRNNGEHWKEQSEYMPQLQEQLSYRIPVLTTHEFQLPQGKIIGCSYPKIQGHIFAKSSFHQRPFAQKVAFFEELSDAMNQLHSVSPNSFKSPLPLKSFIQQLACFLFKDIPHEIEPFILKIEKTFKEKGILLKNNLLCHTDLHSNNVVLDHKKHIVGILDFDSLAFGERFMEFHPMLYKKEDLNLWREIYQKNTQYPIDKEASRCMENLYEQAFFFYSLGSFVKAANVRVKPKTKLVSKNEIKKVFSMNTDRWVNFGR